MMGFSLADYDNAMTLKFQSVFPNTRYSFAEWSFKEDAKVTGGTVELPLLTLYRTGYLYNRTMFTFAEKYYGRGMWSNQTNLTQTNARSISVSITYQFDIWGSTREQMDDLTAEIMMFLEFSPILLVNPKIINAPEPFRFELVFEDGPIDNTDIMSFETHGRVFRNTLFYVIPEARLASTLTSYLVDTSTISYDTSNGSGGSITI